MLKTFQEVFPTLQLNSRLQGMSENLIIEKVTTSKVRNTIRVCVIANDIYEHKLFKHLGYEIKKQLFPDNNTFIIVQETFDVDIDASDFICRYTDSILNEYKDISPVEYSILSDAEINVNQEGFIDINLPDTFICHKMEQNLLTDLDKIFNERCMLGRKVIISYREAEKKDNKADEMKIIDRVENIYLNSKLGRPAKTEAEAGENEANPTVYAQKEEKSKNTSFTKYKKKEFLPPDPNLKYGRNFNDEYIDIDKLIGDIGEVVVRGQIMAVESRSIGNEKTLYMFDITDFTDSIRVKIFVKDIQLEEVSRACKEGSFVMVKGIAALDRFDHELSIASVTGIKAIEDFTTARTDTYPEKRVELHCHTKMSDMDAVAETDAIIKRAAAWGHAAIAITDHGDVQSFPDAFHVLQKIKTPIKVIYGMEGYLVDDLDENGNPDEDKKAKLKSYYHIIMLAKNDIGRVNLYKLVSDSHIKYFKKRPCIPKSELMKHREGLILGSACEAGELYRAIAAGKPEERLKELVDFYDYLEIQPLGNNTFMVESDRYPNITSMDDVIACNKKVIDLGDKYGKMTCATCDVHFLDPEDEVYRRIIMAGKGYKDADRQPPLYFRTTREMLEEFEYLGSDKAYEIVVTNTNKVADMIEVIEPVRPDKAPPVIENSDQTLREICYNTAREMYGDKLPEIVEARLERELNSIISNGYAVMYIIAQKLVWKSNEDGYLVGSRGSVGSSLAATMSGITEVNPLSPHYVCKKCHYVDFESEEVKSYAGKAGCDMPDKNCPVCGEPLYKDGFDIPFETFLGFKGNKEPDIDLNFSGEYQSKSHKYTEVIFGNGQTFRAGTIGTLAEKTAFGYVKNYFEERGQSKRNCEINRIIKGCVGVRRTTGQHPGGIIVLPIGENIYSFTPVQRPANDMTTDTVTTHFDYHSIDHNLLKLDILGHDDPTMIRMLEDLTGIKATEIPLDDKSVMSLFQNTDALGITPDDIRGCKLGALGIPEFGTDFAMQMLIDTKPQAFSDLVRIAGLAHGTDVWLGNAQKLILEGTATISTAICTRDDIMIYLINMGLESELAFTIMESVRKGKGLKPEWEEEMKKHDVPDWYIWSCKKIKYMFPKAHAAAYVMMAWRIAYCKVFYPLAYYAAFFSIRATAFDYSIMCQGREHLERVMDEYQARKDSLSKKEQDTYKDMRIVQEMYARGFEFIPLDIYKAKAQHFQIIDSKLMPAIGTIEGMGEKAAEAVEDAAKDGEFISIDDFRTRTKVSKTVIDLMSELGILAGLPESNQLSLFDMM